MPIRKAAFIYLFLIIFTILFSYLKLPLTPFIIAGIIGWIIWELEEDY